MILSNFLCRVIEVQACIFFDASAGLFFTYDSRIMSVSLEKINKILKLNELVFSLLQRKHVLYLKNFLLLRHLFKTCTNVISIFIQRLRERIFTPKELFEKIGKIRIRSFDFETSRR